MRAKFVQRESHPPLELRRRPVFSEGPLLESAAPTALGRIQQPPCRQSRQRGRAPVALSDQLQRDVELTLSRLTSRIQQTRRLDSKARFLLQHTRGTTWSCS